MILILICPVLAASRCVGYVLNLAEMCIFTRAGGFEEFATAGTVLTSVGLLQVIDAYSDSDVNGAFG